MKIVQAVQVALAARDGDQTDAAARELVLSYAAELDSGGDLTKLGPLLLAGLDALLLTPRSRGKGVQDERPVSGLDELRERRAARASRAAAVDTTA